MTNSIVRTQLNKTLSTSTLGDLLRVRTGSESDIYLLLDVSGSMDRHMRNGKTRLQGLTEVVANIQMEKKTKLIAFGGNDGGAYVTSHVPRDADGGTPLHMALDLAKVQNAGRCIVISDGIPDDADAAMKSAKAFGGQVDVVFVGNAGEHGEEFLRQLAASAGGTEFHGDLSEPKQLGKSIIGLLGNGEDE